MSNGNRGRFSSNPNRPEEYYFRKLEEIENRISFHLSKQAGRKSLGPKKIPNIIVNNNTFNGNVSEMDMQRVIASPNDLENNQQPVIQTVAAVQPGVQANQPLVGYNQEGPYSNSYDSQFSNSDYGNNYNDYGSYNSRSNYNSYDDGYGNDPYAYSSGYDDGYSNDPQNYPSDNNTSQYSQSEASNASPVAGSQAYEYGSSDYNNEYNQEYNQDDYDDDYEIQNQEYFGESYPDNELIEDLSHVKTWNIDFALKNNFVNPARVASYRIENKKLFTRLKLFYSKLIALFEKSNQIEHTLYRQAKRDILSLNVLTTNEDLDKVVQKAKNILSFLAKTDIQFINLLEYDINAGALKESMPKEDKDLITRFIAKYKLLIKKWDLLGGQEVICRLYEMSIQYEEIIQKVTHLMIQRVTSSSLEEVIQQTFVKSVKAASAENDLEAVKNLIIEINKRIVSDYRR